MKIIVNTALILLISSTVFCQPYYSKFVSPTGHYSTSSSGTCLGCSFSNPSDVADNDLSNYAGIHIGASLAGATMGIRAKLNGTASGGTKAGFYVDLGNLLTLFQTVTVTTYKSGAVKETIISNGNPLTIIGGGLGYLCGNTSAGKDFDEVGITFTDAVATLGTDIKVYYAFGGYSTCPVGVLPVKITDVSAVYQNGNPIVKWEAEDEENDVYELQRSNDGVTFNTIYTITSAVNSGSKTFEYTDQAEEDKNVYYRVLVEGAGRTGNQYSKIVSLKSTVQGNNNIMQIIPNPVAGDNFKIRFKGVAGERYMMQLLDNTGKLLYNRSVESVDNNHSVNIHLPSQVTAGIYIVRMVTSNNFVSFYNKLVVVNR